MTKFLDDELVFIDEAGTGADQREALWTILVVDDDDSVHQVTRLALQSDLYDGRRMRILGAHSATEARDVLAREPDIAVVLLDVVMESDDAGLQLVKFIREEMLDRCIRIVLRTGQPGQAPERKVITQYDINDYKEKGELTAQKLFTVVLASLRAYRALRSLEHMRIGLEKIVDASADLQAMTAIEPFAGGALQQLTALLDLGQQAVACRGSALATMTEDDGQIRVLAGSGEFAGAAARLADEALPAEVVRQLRHVLATECNLHIEDMLTTYSPTDRGVAAVLHLAGVKQLDEVDLTLVEIFARNIGTSFHNLLLRNDIEAAQREIVSLLSEAIEARSLESGNHVNRVAAYSELLATGLGLPPTEVIKVRLAAPLHDVGKISIPDSILHKPAKLTPQEWAVMRTHAMLGYQILRKSPRPVVQAGATIALTHHEKWDGSGYPYGLQGEDIPLFGRIVALADVFDALITRRSYKERWSVDAVHGYIREQRGRHFDPKLVDLLCGHIGDFVRISEELADNDLEIEQEL
jgi:response regulator RpfG family c-di-GMP phosphodiesterase